MKLKYNSPVILTYTLISTIVLLIHSFFGCDAEAGCGIMGAFTVGGQGSFSFADPLDYVRMFSHAIGHGSWSHLVGNFMFILLIGPLLEEKYGSKDILFMMIVTAIVTGILNVLFFQTGLLGASGVVFMLILLSSFANVKSGTIPITFILIVVLYLGKEVWQSLGNGPEDHVSHFAHILGGLVGGLFGFFANKGKSKNKETQSTDSVIPKI